MRLLMAVSGGLLILIAAGMYMNKAFYQRGGENRYVRYSDSNPGLLHHVLARRTESGRCGWLFFLKILDFVMRIV